MQKSKRIYIQILKSFSIVVILMLLFQCSKTETVSSTSQNSDPDSPSDSEPITTLIIESELQPFYDTFIDEMQARGTDLSSIPINMVFINPNDTGAGTAYCGRGFPNYQQSGNARVEIVNTDDCWNNFSFVEKEVFIFHELGHALLARPHLNESLPNLMSKSIMCAATSCVNVNVYYDLQEEQRSYYLDEILNQDIDLPNWSNAKNYSRTIVSQNFTDIDNQWIGETVFESTNNTVNPYSYSVDETEFFSPPKSLLIGITDNDQVNTYGQWFRYFLISDFQYCSNLFVDVNIKRLVFSLESELNIYVDLYDSEFAETPFLTRDADFVSSDLGNGFFKFSTKILCLPLETRKFRIRFYAKSNLNTNVYFDDLKIDLYE